MAHSQEDLVVCNRGNPYTCPMEAHRHPVGWYNLSLIKDGKAFAWQMERWMRPDGGRPVATSSGLPYGPSVGGQPVGHPNTDPRTP